MQWIKTIKLSFVSYLTTLSLLSFITILGFASIFSYKYHKDTILNLTSEWTQEISASIYLKTVHYLSPAQHKVAATAKILSDSSNFNIKDPVVNKLLRYSLDQYPQFRSCYIGFDNGDFVMISDDHDLKLTTIDFSNSQKIIQKIDVAQPAIIQENDYDPRTRQWYIGAKQLDSFSWTSPYIFHSNQKLGISVSYPIKHNQTLSGVIAIDILLDELNNFLKQILLTKGSIMYILDHQHTLVAHSLSSATSPHTGIPPQDLLDYSQQFLIDNPIFESRYQTILTYDDREFIVLVQNYSDDFLNQWKSVMVIPSQELFYTLVQSNQQLLFIGFFIIVLGIIIITLFSRSVSKQIQHISNHALKLKELNFESKLELKTQISELAALNSTINTMETGIKSFFHYVPKEVVNRLIKSNQEASISGNARLITLLFTDIAKFTTITETIPPNKLADLLSDYFDKTDIEVKKYNGIIDKFIGDSTMAIWGAPSASDTHAIDACYAGLGLNHVLNTGPETLFKTRIGIHTGQAIVGNMGAKNRFNYTAIGKEVNIANRLEGINKFYSTTILISQPTYDLVKDLFICRPLDKVKVIGISYPLQIYELVAAKNSNNQELQDFMHLFSNAHKLFQRQQWDKALELFTKLKQSHPDDIILNYYITQTNSFIQTPPTSSWDGVIEMTSK